MRVLRKLWPLAAAHSCSRTETHTSKEVGNELLIHDRRAVMRHFYPLGATLRYGVGGGEQRVQIYNFSEKGLCFHSDVRFPVGESVEITTTLPRMGSLYGGRKVRYLAHVTRVSLERGEFSVAALIYSCLTLSPTAEESGESKCNGRKETGSTKQARQRYSPQLDAAASASTETDTRKTQDGRRFSRYACGSQVQFRHENSDQVLCGELANLSLTGCYIQTTQPCAVDTGLEVVVQVGRARIYSPARVKTVRAGEGMGIEFTGDLPQRLRRLQRFVQVLSAAGRPQNNPKN